MKLLYSHDAYAQYYRQRASQLPIFYSPEWQEALCGKGQWKPCVFMGKDDDFIGFCPLYHKKRFGLSYYTQPLYSPALGLYLESNDVSFSALLECISQQFSPFAYLLFRHFGTVKLPDHIRKKSILEKRYTFTLKTDLDEKSLHTQLHKTTRRLIKKASTELTVQCLSPNQKTMMMASNEKSIFQEFFWLYKQNATDKGFWNSEMNTILHNIWNSPLKQKLQLFYILENGTFIGGLLTIMDSQRLYCLASCSQRHPFSIQRLLLWAAILNSKKKKVTFDFGGGNDQGIGQFFQSFGAQKTDYTHCTIYQNAFIKKLLNKSS